MNDSQHPINDQFLHEGYEFHGYTITQFLSNDDFSISYLATRGGVDVVLMEYFPLAMVSRGNNHVDVLLKEDVNQQEYALGLEICRDDLGDLVGFHHSNILDTQTFFEANNTIYRVSEALVDQEWGSLENCLQDKILPENDILSLCLPLLNAIEAIHEIGHIHSDLTPSNIMIHMQSGELKVLGFGDMKYLFRPSTQSLSRHLSPGFSPCENYYANENQGVWTDIYALGAILYRILTGDAPVSSVSRLSSLADHQRDPLFSASSCFEGMDVYSEQLLWAVDHALALQKQDRPESIAEWRKELGLVMTQASEKKASVPSLTIEGISYATQEPSVQEPSVQPPTHNVDFSSLVQHAPQEVQVRHRAYAPVAILGGLISAMLVGMFIYSSSDEPKVAINESYVADVVVENKAIVEEERIAEKQIYSETDYQPILDVPLLENEQEEYAAIRLPFSEYLASGISGVEFDGVASVALLSSVKYLIEDIKITPSNIVVVATEKPLQQTIKYKKTPSSVKAVSRTVKVKHHPGKTREQYQREWLAKQHQMKKRAEWKKRKAQLQKQKNLQTAAQIESQLLADNDW